MSFNAGKHHYLRQRAISVPNSDAICQNALYDTPVETVEDVCVPAGPFQSY